MKKNKPFLCKTQDFDGMQGSDYSYFPSQILIVEEVLPP